MPTVSFYDVIIDGCRVLDGCRKRALVQQPVFNGCAATSGFVRAKFRRAERKDQLADAQ